MFYGVSYETGDGRKRKEDGTCRFRFRFYFRKNEDGGGALKNGMGIRLWDMFLYVMGLGAMSMSISIMGLGCVYNNMMFVSIYHLDICFFGIWVLGCDLSVNAAVEIHDNVLRCYAR